MHDANKVTIAIKPSFASVLPLHVASPWVIDSGTSTHMTGTSSILSDVAPVSRPFRLVHSNVWDPFGFPPF